MQLSLMYVTRFCSHLLLCTSLLAARVFTQIVELGPCDPVTQGEFRIDALYTGEIGTFNIATTALGLDRNAAEMYHLTALGESLSDGGLVGVKGCFEKNSLYRYVVFYDDEAADSFGEYKLFVNGRVIVDGNTIQNPNTFTEFYFYSDGRVCSNDETRFTLTIQFDNFPEDLSWELENLDGSTDGVLRSNQTTIPPPPGLTDTGYGTEFKDDALHVDRCIPRDVRYRFTIFDSFGDGIAFPGFYEIASNGSIAVVNGGDFGSSESTSFISSLAPTNVPSLDPTVAPSVSLAPTNVPSIAPTVAPSVSSIPTSSPTASGAPSVTPFPTSGPTPGPTPSPTLPPTQAPRPPPTLAPTSSPIPAQPSAPNSLQRTPLPTPACAGAAPTSFCANLPDRPPPPPPPSSFVVCFSGSTTVDAKSKGRTQMKDLAIGDEIAVKNGVYEAVYSFGHYEPQGSATLLEIETRRPTGVTLRISHQHLVFVKKNGVMSVVPASFLSVGDALVAFDGGDETEEIVESVLPVYSSDGLYAPFTPSGKFLVNDGLLVSAFVALNNEKAVSVLGVDFTHQWLAHSFEFPRRLICNCTKW